MEIIPYGNFFSETYKNAFKALIIIKILENFNRASSLKSTKFIIFDQNRRVSANKSLKFITLATKGVLARINL